MKTLFALIAAFIIYINFTREDAPEAVQDIITAESLGIVLSGVELQSPVEIGANVDYNELQCLAKNIYFEARSESPDEQIGVAYVALNRANAERFPDTICGVVTQGPISVWYLENKGREVPLRNMCQFSWYCDGKSDIPRERAAWKYAQRIAEEVLKGKHEDPTDGALWYHADYVSPDWVRDFQMVAQLETHLYYRE